jgi:hypothetical protein
MSSEIKILYIWTSSFFPIPAGQEISSATHWVNMQPEVFAASVVVLNGRIVKCRYKLEGLNGERWTSPEDFIKKYNLKDCTPVIERIEIF